MILTCVHVKYKDISDGLRTYSNFTRFVFFFKLMLLHVIRSNCDRTVQIFNADIIEFLRYVFRIFKVS
jgi:hypothetical protein